MSCRRIRRELLWLVRFGDFDAGSAPHLDHLASCQGCRDEVGLDRALVRQLRTALAARVADASPSPSAWEGVLTRMRQPDPSVERPWSARLASFLRAGSAMAGASLALVVALNLEFASIGTQPSPEASGLEISSTGEPARALAGFRQGAGPVAGAGIDRHDRASVVWTIPTRSEQLPLNRSALNATQEEADVAPVVEPQDNGVDVGPDVVLRWVPVESAATAGSSERGSDEPAVAPASPPAGGPS